jgi:hypothetical protein
MEHGHGQAVYMYMGMDTHMRMQHEQIRRFAVTLTSAKYALPESLTSVRNFLAVSLTPVKHPKTVKRHLPVFIALHASTAQKEQYGKKTGGHFVALFL